MVFKSQERSDESRQKEPELSHPALFNQTFGADKKHTI